jgi:hypothetical protein
MHARKENGDREGGIGDLPARGRQVQGLALDAAFSG